MSMRLKKGDMVQIIAGTNKGKTAKVTAVLPKDNAVKVEGINVVKRAVKPNMLDPQGGIVDVHKPIDASKVAIVHPTKKGATSKIGFQITKDGNKTRVYKNAQNKEIQ
jgi:large subunit ribosomal protein L24